MGRSSPYLFLFWQLARAEFKARDQGTVLGFVWTLLHPALMFAVLYAVFVRWLGPAMPNYAGYLLVGLVFWSFFARATSAGLSCFRRRSALLRNYRFPLEILAASSVATVLAFTAIELAILLVLLPWLGAAPSAAWFWTPLVLAVLAGFTAGVTLLLACLASRWRDLERAWDVACAALFYMTPVFYPAELLTGRLSVFAAHPVALALAAARRCLLEGLPPEPASFAALAVVSAAVLAAGLAATRALAAEIRESVIA